MRNFYLFRQSLFTYLFALPFLLSNFEISAGKKVKIRILQTTDLHSFIEEGDEVGSGGLLRVSTLIKKHRRKLGEDKVILLDSGDTIQGSISALATRGEAVIDLLNHLKYDCWVLGNHELDFGIPRLYELVNKTKVPILSGNFKLTKPYEKEFESWKIIERNGARICIIGMQASFLNHWFKGGLYEEYKVEKAYDLLLKEMPLILKENPDMIVLALHHGFLFKDTRGVNEIKDIVHIDQHKIFEKRINGYKRDLKRQPMKNQFDPLFKALKLHPVNWGFDFNEIVSLRNHIYHGKLLNEDQIAQIRKLYVNNQFPIFVGRAIIKFFGIDDFNKIKKPYRDYN